jgi:hypothetical protein
MFKKFILAVIFAALIAPAAFADQTPAFSEDAPLAIICAGSGMILRAEPSNSSAKIVTLAKDETVYAIGLKNTGEEFQWIHAITKDGYKGWFYGEFADYTDKSLNASGRFKAKFYSSVIFSTDMARNIFGEQGTKSDVTEEEKNFTGFADHKITFGSGLTLLCSSVSGKDIFNSAYIKTPGYSVAGLKVGDSENKLAAFSKNMNAIGWAGRYTKGDVMWILYWQGAAPTKYSGGERRAKRGFGVKTAGGKISEIWWCSYLAD